METRNATGADIVQLLLLCAPKETLDGIELTQENAEEEAEHFDELKNGVYGSKGRFIFIEMFAMALYYAAEKPPLPKSEHFKIIESIRIPYFVLHKVVGLARIEEYSCIDKLKDDIQKENRSKKGRILSLKRDWGRYKEAKAQIIAIFASGKYGNSRRKCAEGEYKNLNVCFKKAREYLNGTPDPIRQEPKPTSHGKAKKIPV